MFIRVRSVVGEDVFVNSDRIISIQPTYRYRDGQKTEMVGATLRLAGDFNIQVHETPVAVVDLIERDRADVLPSWGAGVA